ncbi:hypothetical protein TTHERM_01087860 (macronuclear) [Tetrahymena thermophila SB210]|uniref:Uncharacterized protein n=1 Tax=Tetrahymena thermophila (strain SB210) TaxID=312017 RepID=Q23M80_TETTS|nr:hypothetical protein TTHERM_01087860 [Tetrahymena thermophila SB210]EAR97633.1 hypothetical protein TTHERM_01087860 [Tetrahymena thermophila SB210]|eukprot:XP_001017878.1 hypothetical protein TTHERM_01087860 [Tetrahymena thermophila SB210]
MKIKELSPLQKIINKTNYERENNNKLQNRNSYGCNIEDIFQKRNLTGKSALLGGGAGSKDITPSSAATTTFDNISSRKVKNEVEFYDAKQPQLKGSQQVMKQIILTSPSDRRDEVCILKGRKITQRKIMELAQIKTKQLPAHMAQFEQFVQPNSGQNHIQTSSNANKDYINFIQKQASNQQNNSSTVKQTNLNQNGNESSQKNQAQLQQEEQYQNLQDKSFSESKNFRDQSPLYSPKRVHLQTQPSCSPPNTYVQQSLNQIIRQKNRQENTEHNSIQQSYEQSFKSSPIPTDKDALNTSDISQQKKKFYKVRISYFVDPNFPQLNNKNKSVQARDQSYVSFNNKLKLRSNQGNSQKFYGNLEKQQFSKQSTNSQHDYQQIESKSNLPSLLLGSDTQLANTSQTYKKTPIVFPSFPLNLEENSDLKYNNSVNETQNTQTTKSAKINFIKKPAPLLPRDQNNLDNLINYQHSNIQQKSNQNQSKKNNRNKSSDIDAQYFNGSEINQSVEGQLSMAILKKQFQRIRTNTFSNANTKSNLLPNNLVKCFTEQDEAFDQSEDLLNQNKSMNYSTSFQKGQLCLTNSDGKEENLSKFIFDSQILKAGAHLISTKSNFQTNQLNNNNQTQKLQESYQIEAFKEINFQSLRYYYDQKYQQKLVLSPPKLNEHDKRRTQHIDFNPQNRPKVLSLHDSFQPPEILDSVPAQIPKKIINPHHSNKLKSFSQYQSPVKQTVVENITDKNILYSENKSIVVSPQILKEDSITITQKKTINTESRNKNEQISQQHIVTQQYSQNTDEQDLNYKQLDYAESTFSTNPKTINKKITNYSNTNQKYSSKQKSNANFSNHVNDFEKLEPWDNKDKYSAFDEEYLHDFDN